MPRRAQRSGLRRRAIGAGALLCLVASAGAARADTLTLDAPEACASQAGFVAGVRARTPLAAFGPGSGGRTFHVVISAAPPGGPEPWRGALEVTDPVGAKTRRDVDGTTCDEVASALSLVVALTIDPNAATMAAPVPLSAPAAPPPTPPPPPPAIHEVPLPPRRLPPLATRAAYAPRLVVEAVLGGGVAPGPTFGAGVDLGVAREGSGNPLALTLAGHARASVEKTLLSAATPSADTVRALAVVSLCPLAAKIGSTRTELCAGIGAGVARFEGEGAATPSAKLRFWSHVEGALVATVPLGTALFAAVRGSLEVPLTRDELVFVRPDVFVHRAAPIAGNVGLGLGVRL